MDTFSDSSGTTIPEHAVEPGASRPGWSELPAAAKRGRLLDAAIAVFSEHGLEAPMHLVAERAGAGVASVYRVFPSKHDLFAAIVVRRYGELAAAFESAGDAAGDRWSALRELIVERVAHQSPEPFSIEARALVDDRPEVELALARAARAQERLLADARREGRLRADATIEDLRLLFAATRAARRLNPAAVPRMLELLLDALDGSRPSAAGPLPPTPTEEMPS